MLEWDDMLLVTDNVDADGKPKGALGHGEMWFTPTSATIAGRIGRRSSMASKSRPKAGTRNFRAPMRAYDRLPAEVKKRIDGAMVMQGHQYTTGRRIDLTVDIETMHHCRQPIVISNPGTGRKALYVTSQNTMWIEGMDRAESEALLTTMFDFAEDPSIIYEHVWRPGDLVVWDNLACLHARTDWPAEQKRTLRRCTTEGEPLY